MPPYAILDNNKFIFLVLHAAFRLGVSTLIVTPCLIKSRIENSFTAKKSSGSTDARKYQNLNAIRR